MENKNKKNLKRLQDRRRYIASRINSRGSTIQNEVSRIARDLFISERTVYRDYYSVD